MATARQLWDAIRLEMIAVTGLPANQVGIDIIPDQAASAIAQATGGVNAAVSIFDTKTPRNTTRFLAARGPVVEN
jgi:hypothetical protein